MDNRTNGRIDIINIDKPKVDNNELQNSCFTHSDRIPTKEPVSFREALTGNWSNTKLSDLYFSKENIQIIQNGLRAGVYKKSNGSYVIDEQNHDELMIIMRSIYLQYSRNDFDNITEQIKGLNDLVLEYAINQVYGEAQGYMQYKFDASTIAMPLSTPIMEIKNDKQLEFKPRF